MQVTANRPLKGVVVQGANSLPQRLIEDAFRDQFGSTLNFARFGTALETLNKWYEDRDIVGQVCPVFLPSNWTPIPSYCTPIYFLVVEQVIPNICLAQD